ncbi:MAG: hypothetical protein AB1898_10230 [Acidobacteriota bacterium]
MGRVGRTFKMIVTLFFGAVLTVVLLHSAGASAKFTKETGKKCLECHSKIPKKGEKELYLTPLGKAFHENGNKMPEGQK